MIDYARISKLMKSKLFLLLVLHALFILPFAAQDAMPTKEETVNYINKKMQEVVGLERDDMCSPRCARKFTSFSFVLKGDKIEFETRFDETPSGSSRTSKERVIAVFNPAHMISGDAAVFTCSAGKSICLKFPDRLVKRIHYSDFANYGPGTDDDTVHIPLDLRIPELKNRVTKALKHLRDLAKAEDDPFGN